MTKITVVLTSDGLRMKIWKWSAWDFDLKLAAFLRRTDVPEAREAGYQRQSDICASERDEEDEEFGGFQTVRQSADLAACLGEHQRSIRSSEDHLARIRAPTLLRPG